MEQFPSREGITVWFLAVGKHKMELYLVQWQGFGSGN